MKIDGRSNAVVLHQNVKEDVEGVRAHHFSVLCNGFPLGFRGVFRRSHQNAGPSAGAQVEVFISAAILLHLAANFSARFRAFEMDYHTGDAPGKIRRRNTGVQMGHPGVVGVLVGGDADAFRICTVNQVKHLLAEAVIFLAAGLQV